MYNLIDEIQEDRYIETLLADNEDEDLEDPLWNDNWDDDEDEEEEI
jgi:hypothetical protein